VERPRELCLGALLASVPVEHVEELLEPDAALLAGKADL
jgi:hypothetical protein